MTKIFFLTFKLTFSALVDDLGDDKNQEFVTLSLQINGHSERCKVTVTDNRDFQGADGVSKGVSPNECTLAFRIGVL